MRRQAFAIALLLSACVDPKSPPEPIQVQVVLTNPYELGFGDPIGIAVAWTSTSAAVIGPELMIGAVTGTVTFDLEVARPRGLSERKLAFLELAQIYSQFVVIYRPRFIAFVDVNRSGTFDPPKIGDPDGDRIIGADISSIPAVGYIINLDATLERFSLEDSELYYDITGGRYTAMVVLNSPPGGPNPQLSPPLPGAGPKMLVPIVDSPRPTNDILCGIRRGRPTPKAPEPIGFAGTSSVSVSIRVDETLAARETCGLVSGECRGADLDTIELPALATVLDEAFRRQTQCRRNGTLESLVIAESTLECESCRCAWVVRERSFVIDPVDPPAWWPCGDTVPFCASDVELYLYDFGCEDRE